MSALDGIRNTAKSSLDWLLCKDSGEKPVAAETTVSEAQSPKPAEASVVTRPVSVVNPNTKLQGNVDVYQSGTVKQPEAQTGKTPKEKANELSLELKASCKKANIDEAQLMLRLSAITGKTLKEFYEMSPEIRIELISYVNESVNKYIAKRAEGKAENVDGLEAVTMDAYIMYKFITNDKNGKRLDLSQMTPAEIQVRRLFAEEALKNYKKERLAKLENLSETEKEIAKSQMKASMDDMRMHVFEKVTKEIPFESAMQMILFVASKDVGDAAERLLESYPPELRKKVASTMHNINDFKEYVKAAQERGENITSEEALAAFEKYNRVFSSYKTKSAFQQYEQQSVQLRESGELPTEVMQATAMGIGEGVYTNHVMSSSDKESVLQTWVKDNNGFLSDTQMEQVELKSHTYIQEYLDKHPEEKDKFAYVEKSMKEIVESTLKREFKPENSKPARAAEKRKQGESSGTSEAQAQVSDETSGALAQAAAMSGDSGVVDIAYGSSDIEASGTIRTGNLGNKDDAEAGIKQNVTEEEVRVAVLSGTMSHEQAKKAVGEDVLMKIYVKDMNLRDIYESKIKQYIVENRNDKEKMQELIKYSPEDIQHFIVTHMPDGGDVAQEMIDRHEVSYNARVMFENDQSLQKDLKNDAA